MDTKDTEELIAGMNGWQQCPDGRWWRELQDGDEIAEEHLALFMGSGPFVWADSASQALEIDGIDLLPMHDRL